MAEKQVVIIGAGPAGLTAAYELLKTTDIVPVILEKSDAIGGISRTVAYKGNRIDIGGHRFFTKSDEVNRIWQELLPMQGNPAFDDQLLGREKPLQEGGPDPESEDRVMLCRDRVSRIYYLKKFFDYPISVKPETFKSMGFARTIRAGFGYVWSVLFKRKEKSLADFYINRFGAPLYRMFFEGYTEKVWGRNPSQLSPDWGAQRVKGLSLWKAILSFFKPKKGKAVETSLIEQYAYPKFGPGQLWETMADEIRKMGGKILLETDVTGFATGHGAITEVRARTKDGERCFPADAVFSSMPVKDLLRAMPDVPEEIHAISDTLPYRDFMTAGLLLDRLKIRNQTDRKTLGDIVPDCWIYIQEPDVKLGRLQIFNNWSPYMVKDPEHTVWVGLEYFCNEGDGLWNMEDGAFVSFAADELASIGIIDRDAVKDGVCIRMEKAYPAYFDGYDRFDEIRAYLDTVPNLYCIGRNGQHRYNNMDHSMLTAIEAVRVLRGESGDKTGLWNVNTEKEYHETKSEARA